MSRLNPSPDSASAIRSALGPWIDAEVIGIAAVQVAVTFAAEESFEVALALALAVEAVRESDTCVDLDRVAERFGSYGPRATAVDPGELPGAGASVGVGDADRDGAEDGGGAGGGAGDGELPWPGEGWLDQLDRSPLVHTVETIERRSDAVTGHTPDGAHPDPSPRGLLVLEGSRVFLRRLWMDESDVNHAFRRLHRSVGLAIDAESEQFIESMFAKVPAVSAAAPVAAVRAALTRSLTVVTGGPGTGKTWTLARMLAAVWHRDPLAKVSLTAPTGKAAKRMKDAIDEARGELALSEELDEQFGSTAPVTLHRFLGMRPGSAPRFNSDNRVDADVVVVDEASMVSLPLMAQLLRALPDSVSLILLGDPFQLASVEAGSVLGDLVAPESTLIDAVARLEINHRSIPELDNTFRAVNDGDADRVIELLSQSDAQSDSQAVTWVPVPDGVDRVDLGGLLRSGSLDAIMDHAAATVEAADRGDAAAANSAAAAVKVLCATHRGALGVDAWTESIEAQLLPKRTRHLDWYGGRPVMVTRNDYVNGLFNGDTGVIVDGHMSVFDQTSTLRSFAPESLSDIQTWWAMSIHKSQGSEFDHVVVSFDAPRNSRSVVSRELLYTALTRARQSVTVVASERAIRWAVEHQTLRFSGLADRLGG